MSEKMDHGYTTDGDRQLAADQAREHLEAQATLLGERYDSRIHDLESELERIRPVYEAACTWRDAGRWMDGMCYRYFQESDAQDVNDGVASAVDTARTPR